MSLSEDDVAYLDEYARSRRLGSRSWALREAIRLLRASELASGYEDAWSEWSAGAEDRLWDAAVDDGLV